MLRDTEGGEEGMKRDIQREETVMWTCETYITLHHSLFLLRRNDRHRPRPFPDFHDTLG